MDPEALREGPVPEEDVPEEPRILVHLMEEEAFVMSSSKKHESALKLLVLRTGLKEGLDGPKVTIDGGGDGGDGGGGLGGGGGGG